MKARVPMCQVRAAPSVKMALGPLLECPQVYPVVEAVGHEPGKCYRSGRDRGKLKYTRCFLSSKGPPQDLSYHTEEKARRKQRRWVWLYQKDRECSE